MHEILVVDDGSSDATAAEAAAAGATVVQHPQNRGYGRSLKTGIVQARYDLIAITDADGTYPAERLPELIALVRSISHGGRCAHGEVSSRHAG